MKKQTTNRALLFVLAIHVLYISTSHSADFGIASSGRYITLKGEPFFWLGDTVWLLNQLPSREELEFYLRTRAEQGFTVIQLTAVMGEERVWGTARRTSRGDVPFENNDVLKPAVTLGNSPNDATEYDYWDHLDYVLARIDAHGFRAALVTYFVGWQGDGYKFLKPENAYEYGRFLGQRYRGKPEILWLLGGDNTPNSEDKKTVWNRVAKGLAEGLTGKEDYSQVLMTYHINGGASSSQIWHESPWLDFNMAQTWSAYQDIHPALLRDYQKTPHKPCGLGEGAYEDGPQYPTKPIDGLVIRKQACWSYFAGGYHTYGNGNVWHFDSCKPELTQPWKAALRSKGAETLKHVKKFLTSIRCSEYIPDQSLFQEGKGSEAKLNVAMHNPSNNAIAVYVSNPGAIKLTLKRMKAGKLSGRWVNPASGEEIALADVHQDKNTFPPPTGWEDALLVISGQ